MTNLARERAVEKKIFPAYSLLAPLFTVPCLLMSRGTISEFFNQGLELFNEGQFFACHEVWEEAWKRSQGAEKLFYQGLIQAAVAILHAQRGNLPGARSLWDKASAKLRPLPAEHMGIALSELLQNLECFFEPFFSGQCSTVEPPKIRRLSG